MDHIPSMPGIELELACNGDACRGISSKKDKCNLRLKRLPALVPQPRSQGARR